MEHKIIGTTMPVLEFNMKEGEKIFAQTGAMKWMSPGIRMETKMAGGLGGALKRKMMGESSFFVYFTSERDNEKLAFGHTFPGNIMAWNISQSSVICQKRAFLCATEGVNLDIHFQKRLGVGFFGGEGFIMQKLSGNGMAFVELDGETIEIDLAQGQSIKVETSAVGMFEESVNMDISSVKGVRNALFGGEGLFLTTLTGPGKVWLQSMPIQSMVAEMSGFLPKSNSSR